MNKIKICFLILTAALAVTGEELIFDSDKILSLVRETIENSTESIFVLTETVSHKDLADLLSKKSMEKVKVELILASSSFDKSYSRHKALLSSGALIFSLQSKNSIRSTHILSDGKILVSGSFPFSDEKYFGRDFCIKTERKESVDNFLDYFLKLKSKCKIYEQVSETLLFDSIAPRLNDFTNKELFIRGIVSDVTKSPKSETYFLKLKKNKAVMTIVFFESFVKQLEKKSVNPMYFKGKEILINGLLIKHEKYGFEILPADVGQIKIYVD
ncbi:MAG: exodeoxyribonuclease VII large subunit [bacterium]|nr:exodeoxyribonuclease VII large subunit [bacterium]